MPTQTNSALIAIASDTLGAMPHGVDVWTYVDADGDWLCSTRSLVELGRRLAGGEADAVALWRATSTLMTCGDAAPTAFRVTDPDTGEVLPEWEELCQELQD